ncbi:MAG: hypothetical protein ACI9YG_000295, partial [Candidatus Azotimanducaceae bacterium]
HKLSQTRNAAVSKVFTDPNVDKTGGRSLRPGVPGFQFSRYAGYVVLMVDHGIITTFRTCSG